MYLVLFLVVNPKSLSLHLLAQNRFIVKSVWLYQFDSSTPEMFLPMQSWISKGLTWDSPTPPELICCHLPWHTQNKYKNPWCSPWVHPRWSLSFLVLWIWIPKTQTNARGPNCRENNDKSLRMWIIGFIRSLAFWGPYYGTICL